MGVEKQQALIAEVYTHVVILSSGSHYYLTDKKFQQYKQAGKGDVIQLEDGSSFSVSHVVDTPTVEKYEQLHGKPADEPRQQPPSRALESFEDIVEMFNPVAEKFGFHRMMELTVKTHRALSNWQGSFHEFCVKNKAITADGKIITAKYRDSKGNTKTAVFAYPFFCAVNKLIEDRKRKQDYAEGKSWDEIGKMAEQIGQN